MSDETTKMVMEWDDVTWLRDQLRMANEQVEELTAERADIDAALNDLPDSYTESVPSSINNLLAWHKQQKAKKTSEVDQ